MWSLLLFVDKQEEKKKSKHIAQTPWFFHHSVAPENGGISFAPWCRGNSGEISRATLIPPSLVCLSSSREPPISPPLNIYEIAITGGLPASIPPPHSCVEIFAWNWQRGLQRSLTSLSLHLVTRTQDKERGRDTERERKRERQREREIKRGKERE